MGNPNLKQLPSSQEAEEAILGSILLNNKVMHDLVDLISEDDFYNPQCRTIYKHILDMWDKGDPIDVITLQESLKRTNELERIGGYIYIDNLFDQVPASENARHYAQILRDKTLRRSIIMTGQELVEYAYTSEDKENEIRDAVGQHFIHLSQDSDGKSIRAMSSLVDKLLPELKKRMVDKGWSGLNTGYEDLNARLGGFQKSDLIILAARPSVGKTALALNIAEKIARNKGRVLFFSLEMSAEQLALRLLTSISGMNSQRIRNGEISDKDWRSKISPALDVMDEMKINIVDNASITPLQIRSHARRVKLDRELGVDLIIVDYLQLISFQSQRYEGRVQEVSEISRSLKSLARELEVPILAISQLSRESEKQMRPPRLSDLRESGALEQDADVVMFIHRRIPKQGEEQKPSLDGLIDSQLIIAKHRNGPTGVIFMKFDKTRTLFSAATGVRDVEFEDDRGYQDEDSYDE
jgi:replicative DNA helicase